MTQLSVQKLSLCSESDLAFADNQVFRTACVALQQRFDTLRAQIAALNTQIEEAKAVRVQSLLSALPDALRQSGITASFEKIPLYGNNNNGSVLCMSVSGKQLLMQANLGFSYTEPLKLQDASMKPVTPELSSETCDECGADFCEQTSWALDEGEPDQLLAAMYLCHNLVSHLELAQPIITLHCQMRALESELSSLMESYPSKAVAALRSVYVALGTEELQALWQQPEGAGIAMLRIGGSESGKYQKTPKLNLFASALFLEITGSGENRAIGYGRGKPGVHVSYQPSVEKALGRINKKLHAGQVLTSDDLDGLRGYMLLSDDSDLSLLKNIGVSHYCAKIALA